MSKLMRSCQILNENNPKYADSPFKMDNDEALGFIPMSEVLALIEPNDSVIKVLFRMKCTNKVLRNELGKLFGHLLFEDDRSMYFCKKLLVTLNEAYFFEIQNYEIILFSLLTMQDSHIKERANESIKLLSRVIDNNSSNFAFMENLTSMLIKF